VTTNDLKLSFCVKICFEIGMSWVACSEFETKLFENLDIYAYTVAAEL